MPLCFCYMMICCVSTAWMLCVCIKSSKKKNAYKLFQYILEIRLIIQFFILNGKLCRIEYKASGRFCPCSLSHFSLDYILNQ